MTPIEILIPDTNSNWIVRKNILYYKKLALIPIGNVIDGDLFINFDRRCLNQVIKLVLHCISNKIIFKICDKDSITEKHIWNENLDGIIINYLCMLEDPRIFDLVQTSKFPYLEILNDFIETFSCQHIFSRVYQELKSDYFNQTYFDWNSRKRVYKIQNTEIRDYYNCILRNIKIISIFTK